MPTSTRFLDAALDAHRRGFHVWPAAPGGKSPLVHAYAGDPDFGASTEAEVRALSWEHGVCIMLGSGQYVLDADTAAAAADLRLTWGRDTLRVATKRGVHAYFALPPGVLLRQGRQVMPGLDGKGLAATGSRTVALWAAPDGRHVEKDVPVQPMPAELQALVGGARPRQYRGGDDLSAAETAAAAALSYPSPGSPPLSANACLNLLRPLIRSIAAALDVPGAVWGSTYYKYAEWGAHDLLVEGVELHDLRAVLVDDFDHRDALRTNPDRVYTSIDNGLAAGLRRLLAENAAA